MLLRAQKRRPLKDKKLEREIVIHLKNELLEEKKKICVKCAWKPSNWNGPLSNYWVSALIFRIEVKNQQRLSINLDFTQNLVDLFFFLNIQKTFWELLGHYFWWTPFMKIDSMTKD